MSSQYIVVNQSRDREPTEYENLLADSLEKAFGAGIADPGGLVRALEGDGVPAPGGRDWNEELILGELKRLGA